VTEEAKGAKLAQAICALVEQALKRRGQRTGPRLEGNALVLGRGAAEARADIAGTLAQWPELPDDLRAKRVEQIAELLSAPPLAVPGRPRAPMRRRAGWASLFAPLFVVAVTAGVLVVAYRYLAPNGASLLNLARGERARPSVSGALAPADPDRERALLAGTACEQSLARVARGANIGPADVEGWVVELVLLRRAGGAALMTSPALDPFLAKKPNAEHSSTRVVSWSGARSLLAAQRFDAEVNVRPLLDLGSQRLSGVSLEFSGPYVVPYFSDDQRADYFMLADAMSEALQITDGALFAHCAGNGGHHIGTWFLGATPGAAVASLVYFMAFFSEAPLLRSDLLGSGNAMAQGARAFDTITAAAADLDRSGAAALIGAELGMISGRPKQPTRLTFPFRDANRATRASLVAARALRLAEREER
jgi:serine/threonine-protein kinase